MPHRILVVDDSPDILALFNDLLTEEGYLVLTRSYRIIDMAELRLAAPDLIILDHWLHNEELSDVTIRHIRAQADLADIPIIICTGISDVSAVLATTFKWPRVSFISKPFDIEDLYDMVKALLTTAPAEPQHGSSEAADGTLRYLN